MKKLLIIIFLGLILSGCSGSGNYYYDDTSDYYDESESRGTGITRDNWECTEDCSGHEAGFTWAEDNGISDPSDCGGNSQSFIEGCEAYANEQLQDQNEGYEGEDYFNY